jgi:hypothetical protein
MGAKTQISYSTLMRRIETFGYQMAEMAANNARATDAQMAGKSEDAIFFRSNAELYRSAANELKKDIANQLRIRELSD